MKKILSVLLLLVSVHVFAQNYPITGINISMPASPDANTANWGQGTSPFTISAKTTLDSNRMVDGSVVESRVLVTIKKGGSKVCGTYTNATAPFSSFTTVVKVWNGRNAVSLLGQDCTLQPGDYQLCVQFFGSYNGTERPFSEEKCKAFTIRGAAATSDITYQPPQNILPADGTLLKEADAKKPVTFRWTPVVPKPQGNVVYKVKVFEIRKGQSATEAMKTGSTLFEKEVINQTQFVYGGGVTVVVWPIAKDSKYGWYVEARNENGNLYGSSEPTSFSTGSPCTPEYSLKFDDVVCGQDGKVHVTGHIAITPKSGVSISQITIVSLKTPNAFGTNISTSITLPYNLTASGNNYPFSFIVNDNLCDKQLYFTYSIISNCASTPGLPSTIYCADSTMLPCCRCNTCDQVQWQTPELIKYDTSLFRGTNNIMTLYGNINFGPQKIVKLSTEIIDFYWYTEGDCKKCNSNDYYFGNLVSATATGLTATSVADESGIPLASSHQIDFVSPTLSGVALNTPIALNISLPPQTQLSCCTDCFRFCIRYTATFMENGVCKTCSIVKCYESKRTHRKNGLQQWPQPNQCGDVIFPPHGGGGVLQNGTKQQ